MSIDFPELPVLKLSGSHRDIGLRLGAFGKPTIHRYLLKSHVWAQIHALKDHPFVADARELVQKRFPEYWLELEGIADGAEVPADDLFAWNCRGDLLATIPDGCTTVMIPGETPVIAHNEDGSAWLRGGCAIAEVEPAGRRPFKTFVYPGSIPGHTFSVNDAGIAFTVNNIRSRAPGKGFPRMFLTRAILDCAVTDEVRRILEDSPRFGAYHVSVGRVGSADIFSMEFTHHRCSIKKITRPCVHSNHLIHEAMAEEPQIITGSSQSRQDRGNELIQTAEGALDPLVILHDGNHPVFPIFRRQPDDPDDENTLAGSVFELGQSGIIWKVYSGNEGKLQFSGALRFPGGFSFDEP
ncbi:MAG: C45 family peptidase [Methylobacteriaceae bacterium]|jgi:predicted choloylglycine hydrolase|nr:C45 family peptidase [Methylobacteriaceae bacterium]